MWYTARVTRRRAITRAASRIALRTLKWGTLAAALLVAGVWAGEQRTAPLGFQRVGNSEVWVHGHWGGMQIHLQPSFNPMMHEFWKIGHGAPYMDTRHVWAPSIESHSNSVTVIMIPYWLPILLFASISGGLFWRDRRASRRANAGDCPSCGYSRAGLAHGVVCPECAAAAP